MLTLDIPAREFWDPKNECFVERKGHTLQLEHSLVSVSKWESIWCEPFLSEDNKKLTDEKFKSYVRCMTITQNVDEEVYESLTNKEYNIIREYIASPRSATKFPPPKRKEGESRKKETITSELIYYWMTANQIPFECQRWFLNRLLNLIHICGIKNKAPDKPKRMTRNDLLKRNALNDLRRKQNNTRG